MKRYFLALSGGTCKIKGRIKRCVLLVSVIWIVCHALCFTYFVLTTNSDTRTERRQLPDRKALSVAVTTNGNFLTHPLTTAGKPVPHFTLPAE